LPENKNAVYGNGWKRLLAMGATFGRYTRSTSLDDMLIPILVRNVLAPFSCAMLGCNAHMRYSHMQCSRYVQTPF